MSKLTNFSLSFDTGKARMEFGFEGGETSTYTTDPFAVLSEEEINGLMTAALWFGERIGEEVEMFSADSGSLIHCVDADGERIWFTILGDRVR